GVTQSATETSTKLDQIRRALDQAPWAPAALGTRVREQARRLAEIQRALSGDRSLGSRSDAQPSSISERVQSAAGSLGRTLQAPTATSQEQYRIAVELLGVEVGKLRQLMDTDVPALERALDEAGVPYTTGRRIGQ
ncbi:MAG: glycosyl hydrolase, partial [Gemmatimonadetes bacterium]|nr:glycosyl hydrolase [Gemmatimonadota bacterium]